MGFLKVVSISCLVLVVGVVFFVSDISLIDIWINVGGK